MANAPKSAQVDSKIPFYRDDRWLRKAAQVFSLLAIIGLIYVVVTTFNRTTEARGIEMGFGYLGEAAGFPISEAHIEYDPTMTFGRAFLVGLVNTLLVSVTGIIAATILGTLVALGRLSKNWLLSRLALVFIEFHRNIPLLVLLYLWYFTVLQQLPSVQNSLIYGNDLIILNQRGFILTWPRLTDTGSTFAITVYLAVAIAIIVFNILRKKRELTGKETHYGKISLAILIGLPVIGWIASGGSPFSLDVPVLVGFNYQGGLRITPEFAGVLVALVTYTAGFIAEVVRAGIQAVDKGQLEAAQAVGLTYFQVLNLVIMPQALRIIIPPMISQYLNLTKNSSLALIIGFQDLFAIGKITINSAGRAIQVFAMVMGTYLILSLIVSLILNLYNKRIQFVTS